MLRTILLRLADSKRLARFVVSNSLTRRMSHRFVAGESLDEAIDAARALNTAGRQVSLDYLGESVRSESEAREAGQTAVATFDRIAAEKLDANVSVKLTQFGLDLSAELCEKLMREVVQSAESRGNFVRMDMEGSVYTQRTIDMCKRLRASSSAVGVVLQSYLYRTEQDARELLGIGCRLRLCKGAYSEPAAVAYPEKKDVDANYVKVMQLLLPSGVYCGIATHDPKMIAEAKNFAKKNAIGLDQFEFQMLYGIRTDLQEKLVRSGYRLRVYLPYGQDWFPYFMRRLAERPANIWFLLRNALRPW
jgi:proline dehydrogenase